MDNRIHTSRVSLPLNPDVDFSSIYTSKDQVICRINEGNILQGDVAFIYLNPKINKNNYQLLKTCIVLTVPQLNHYSEWNFYNGLKRWELFKNESLGKEWFDGIKDEFRDGKREFFNYIFRNPHSHIIFSLKKDIVNIVKRPDKPMKSFKEIMNIESYYFCPYSFRQLWKFDGIVSTAIKQQGDKTLNTIETTTLNICKFGYSSVFPMSSQRYNGINMCGYTVQVRLGPVKVMVVPQIDNSKMVYWKCLLGGDSLKIAKKIQKDNDDFENEMENDYLKYIFYEGAAYFDIPLDYINIDGIIRKFKNQDKHKMLPYDFNNFYDKKYTTDAYFSDNLERAVKIYSLLIKAICNDNPKNLSEYLKNIVYKSHITKKFDELVNEKIKKIMGNNYNEQYNIKNIKEIYQKIFDLYTINLKDNGLAGVTLDLFRIGITNSRVVNVNDTLDNFLNVINILRPDIVLNLYNDNTKTKINYLISKLPIIRFINNNKHFLLPLNYYRNLHIFIRNYVDIKPMTSGILFRYNMEESDCLDDIKYLLWQRLIKDKNGRYLSSKECLHGLHKHKTLIRCITNLI